MKKKDRPGDAIQASGPVTVKSCPGSLLYSQRTL